MTDIAEEFCLPPSGSPPGGPFCYQMREKIYNIERRIDKELTEIRVEITSMDKDVKAMLELTRRLNQVIVIGNGKPSLMARIDEIERQHSVESKQHEEDKKVRFWYRAAFGGGIITLAMKDVWIVIPKFLSIFGGH